MSGVMPLLHLYAFMTWTGKTLPFQARSHNFAKRQ